MFKKNYYCLVAGLPDLIFQDIRSGLNTIYFQKELKEQLTAKDYSLIQILFNEIDNQNLLNLLFKCEIPFQQPGSFSQSELEKEIQAPHNIPVYMKDYILYFRKLESKDYSLEHENQLYRKFYEYVLKTNNQFLISWYNTQLNLKNLLAFLNCRKFNYSLENHLIQIPSNSSFNEMLTQRNIRLEMLEEEFPLAGELFRIFESGKELLDTEKAIDKLRWNYLDDATFFYYFSIEKIVSYVCKLLISERWKKIDAQTGTVFFNRLLKEIKESFEFSENIYN